MTVTWVYGGLHPETAVIRYRGQVTYRPWWPFDRDWAVREAKTRETADWFRREVDRR